MNAFIHRFFPRLFFRLFYLGNPPWDSGITPPEVEEFIQNHPPGRAIDLGCGTGTNVITLAQHGWQARGVDFVPRAIRQARRKARTAGVQVDLYVGDVTDPKFFNAQYDLILDIGCYHALSVEQRAVYRQNIAAHLAPAGNYMLYAFSGDDPGRFTPQDLAAFEKSLALEKRQDSLDHGERNSAWLWFRPKKVRPRPNSIPKV